MFPLLNSFVTIPFIFAALETPSTPSSQAFTSPRNSISANSGVRTSLIEKYKKKEQIGIVNRGKQLLIYSHAEEVQFP